MTNQRDFNSDWFFEGYFLFSVQFSLDYLILFCFIFYFVSILILVASKKLRFSYTVKVRKHWELAYIYTNFRELITPTNKGLVFGECNTALTPYFISQGLMLKKKASETKEERSDKILVVEINGF